MKPVQEKEVCYSQKAERSWRSEEDFDIRHGNSEFAQLVFGLALVQYFLTVFPFLPFGMVMDILCHCRLEVCDLLFHFDFTGVIVRDDHEYQRL